MARLIAILGCKFRQELHFAMHFKFIDFMATLDKGGLGVNLQNPGHEEVLGA